ncbi:MAG: SMP-30/gluconolactonase/LRE family protein [Paracoccus sp. (in: a-proteobacteria)]|uniref:SMP-30/gluconolactonase/LRE family protein n=1 Tax=Paracoccus sp. TaxID=267 RepID=UPI0039E48588
MDFAPLADLKGRLLESPVWDADRGRLFLCDIEAGLIHRIALDGRAERRPISRLYRVPAAGAGVVIDGGVEISNGLAWSAEGRRMFWSDSRGPWIDLLDFGPATGAPANRRRIRVLDEATGRPDGGACDAKGFYWSAGVSAGVINRFSPDGALDRRVPFPVPAPTMPCFCGPGLRRMAVTSHRLGDENPLSGGLFLAPAPVAGVPVTRMKGV